MTEETKREQGRIIAKRIEFERDRAAAQASLPIVPIAETADTVTLRRSDYDAMRYAVFSK